MSQDTNDIGIKKILITESNNPFTQLSEGLPAEAAALLAAMQKSVAPGTPKELDPLSLLSQMQASTMPVDKASISNTSPGIKHDIQAEIANSQSYGQNELIRTVPEEIRKARELQEILDKVRTANEKEKFTIYDEQGLAFGIIVGTTTKQEANKIMSSISKVAYTDDDNELIAFYNDIYVTILYNDEMIVREIQFGNKYRGTTTKGLRTGDSIEDAIAIYGQPKMKSVRGALWNKFGVFCENNFITAIRLMS